MLLDAAPVGTQEKLVVAGGATLFFLVALLAAWTVYQVAKRVRRRSRQARRHKGQR